MLVEPNEKELATTLDLSIMMFACQRVGNLTKFQTKINLTKIQGSSMSVKFLEVHFCPFDLTEHM